MFALRGIDAQPAAHDGRLVSHAIGAWSIPCTPEYRLDAGFELSQAERFCDVVVRAHLQPEHLVDDIVFGGQHEYGQVADFLTQLLAHCQSIHFRQHQVEDNCIRRIVERRFDAV